MADLIATIAAGDRRKSLEAIRDHLAGRISSAGPRDLAPIARELRETIRELDDLPVAEEESGVDQLAKQREERLKRAASA